MLKETPKEYKEESDERENNRLKMISLIKNFNLSTDGDLMDFGWCTKEEFVRYEAGVEPIPEKLDNVLTELLKLYRSVITESLLYYKNYEGEIRYFERYRQYQAVERNASLLSWKMYLSAASYVAIMLDLKLSESTKYDEESPLRNCILAERNALAGTLVYDS